TALLQRYFNGMASRDQLAPYVEIQYAESLKDADQDKKDMLVAFEEPLPEGIVMQQQSADIFALQGENVAGGRLRIRPGMSGYFNDPAGAFKFEVYGLANYTRPLARQLFFQSELKLTLWENISDVTQASNSELPHVRSDIAEYKKGSDFKLTRLLVNRFFHPAARVYGRLSAGIYEEMFSGAGGQALYLSRNGKWSTDLALDWVRQRDFEGWFGHQDYRTVTTIASVAYRLPERVTATLRAGRFLAKDEGVRMEVKRRFASGFEVGAWYTVTNGNDITSPGTPSNPYYDKGIFMAMPLETLLPHDSQAIAGFSLAPWTRDVGQMVGSPGDLARITERPVWQMHERDGLERFGDREDNP
ncbi:MAG TPA: YjbH domain-containing protein, partial [Burkholderiales bacterium]|nr:YjbH domain-containing protein [Burkholderiales bacterium]